LAASPANRLMEFMDSVQGMEIENKIQQRALAAEMLFNLAAAKFRGSSKFSGSGSCSKSGFCTCNDLPTHKKCNAKARIAR